MTFEDATPDRRHSMGQLDRLLRTEQPAYQAAVDARGGEPARHTAALRAVTFVACVASGLVLTVGAQQLTVGDEAAGDHHARLVTSVRQGRAEVAARETRAAALQSDIARLEAEGAGAADARLDHAISTAAARADYAPVAGPGLRLTLDDRALAGSTGGDSRVGSGAGAGRVTYRDIQTVVNAMWQAGAEAVAVNGIRMTALSTIRFAGQAIIVDFTPLAPPYVITAIGEQEDLYQAVSSGTVASLRQSLGTAGASSEAERQDRITLEGGRSDLVRSARPAESSATEPVAERSQP